MSSIPPFAPTRYFLSSGPDPLKRTGSKLKSVFLRLISAVSGNSRQPPTVRLVNQPRCLKISNNSIKKVAQAKSLFQQKPSSQRFKIMFVPQSSDEISQSFAALHREAQMARAELTRLNCKPVLNNPAGNQEKSSWSHFLQSFPTEELSIPPAKLLSGRRLEASHVGGRKKLVRFAKTVAPEPVSTRSIPHVSLPRVSLHSVLMQARQASAHQ